MDIKLKTVKELYEHYKNVRRRIEEAGRLADIKNGVIVLPIKKIPSVENQSTTVDVQKECANVVSLEPPKNLSETQRILYDVALKHGIRVSDICGQSRQKNFVLARHEAMWEIKKRRPSMSLPKMGKLFGDRDHSTVLHAIRKHQERLDAQKELCV